jgi:hypothetical protein
MKSQISGALETYLDGLITESQGATLLIADLYTFTLMDVSTGAPATVIRLTSWAVDVTIGGFTFSSAGPYLTRSTWKQSVGFTVDELSITLLADPSNMVGVKPILQAIATGEFDGATVKLERLFMAAAGDVSLGTVIVFVGSVADIRDCSRTKATLTVRSKMELLNTPLPRNLYQPNCRYILGDANCTIDLESFRVSGVVGASPNKVQIPTNLTQPGPVSPPSAPTITEVAIGGTQVIPGTPTWFTYSVVYAVITYLTANGETAPSPETHFGPIHVGKTIRISAPSTTTGAVGWNVYVSSFSGQEQKQNGAPLGFSDTWTMLGSGLVQGAPPPTTGDAGYFDEGEVTFTNGPNAGVTRHIDKFRGGVITVVPGLPFLPIAGNTLSATPGCGKNLASCDSKYHNLVNFPGTSFIPVPEVGV